MSGVKWDHGDTLQIPADLHLDNPKFKDFKNESFPWFQSLQSIFGASYLIDLKVSTFVFFFLEDKSNCNGLGVQSQPSSKIVLISLEPSSEDGDEESCPFEEAPRVILIIIVNHSVYVRLILYILYTSHRQINRCPFKNKVWEKKRSQAQELGGRSTSKTD